MNDTQQFTPERDRSKAAASGSIGSPRNFVLACIGLVSLLADEIPLLLERSVQRGSVVLERAQTEAGRRRVAPSKTALPIPAELQSELSRRGLPTHHDLEALLQQVTELEQQIDRLAAERAASQ
jgi:hypothetical protein